MRRRALLIVLLSGLGGCGFRPAFEPNDAGLATSNLSELAAIDVPVFAERSGMLMRQALQQRLYGVGDSEAKRYRLLVDFGVSTDALAYQPDNSVARIRITGTGRWVLYSLSPTLTVLTSGSARSMDGINPIDNQSFAQDEESEVVTRRLASTLADQIVLQLAAYFDHRDRITRT